MKPIRIPPLDSEQLAELEEMYRTTRDARLRTRAQMVLLAAERRMTAAQIAEIVRASEETVRRWLKRYLAEGTEGLRDEPHPGAPRKVTEDNSNTHEDEEVEVVLRGAAGRLVLLPAVSTDLQPLAEPHRDALAALPSGGNALRTVPYHQGTHRGGLRLLRSLQPMSVAGPLDHRF